MPKHPKTFFAHIPDLPNIPDIINLYTTTEGRTCLHGLAPLAAEPQPTPRIDLSHTKGFTSTAQGVKMNNKNWEEIYESILKDIVTIVEGNRADYEKVEFITSLLVSNDFMEKPEVY